jgi:diacylglycerol kinase (ATP)
MRYTFILNPAAGHGAAARRRRAVEAAVAASGLDADLRLTEGPGHAFTLAREAAAEKDVVVAVGGDGTVQEVSGGILASRRPVHLGVLPLGTGNDFVKMLGMPSEPRAAVEALRRARPQAVDYGRVRWWEDGKAAEGTFVNAVGIGFDAQVAGEVGAFKFLPGVAAYLAAVLRTLARWKAPRVRVTVEQAAAPPYRYEGPLLLTTAGNGTCSGGGFYLTPAASVTDGLLDVCLIEGISVPRILQLLPFTLFGRHIHAREVHMHRGVRIHLESDAPLPVHADGELLTRAARRLEIEVVPGGLSALMAPR